MSRCSLPLPPLVWQDQWHRFDQDASRPAPRRLHPMQVCHSKVEELRLDSEGERVDVLVSEPMGTLLVNERMLETYLYARDHFLKPGGKMFPVGWH